MTALHSSFYSMVHNLHNLNSKVTFTIDGVDIPVSFNLKQKLFTLPTLSGIPGDDCIQVVFDEAHGTVDIASYYLGFQPSHCQPIDHATFFNVVDIVAALYGTKLSVVSDQSYKVINGFTIPSAVLSMTKENGRNFYEKYGFVSTELTPARQLASYQFKQPSIDLINDITSFEGPKESEEGRKLTQRVKDLRDDVVDVITGNADLSDPNRVMLFKVPGSYTIQLQGSQSVDGPYTDIANDIDYHDGMTAPPFLRIIATISGGRKSRKKRKYRRKRKSRRYI